ncbi:outer membrane protein transport protein [Sphingobacteriaceae bacterium WQ 2009]|uniref:Outer membrane protein transport protein n=1 Tax=Rhinopithecimicrobium faecis TaxID=2820698 RepID=A0A8T4H6N3_9SPHI|nr:outer membrane protein transport protein [Sphingobacteriaceae bacterium WQ 2009]
MKKLLLGIALAAPILLFGQGSQVNLQGMKQVGMGGAGAALIIDESTIVYNPGALSRFQSNGIQINGAAVMYKSAFQEVNSGSVANTKNSISPPFSVFAAFGPQASKFKFGVGIYTPYGGGVDWGTEWEGKYNLASLALRAIYIQPTVSYRITDRLSIGGGFVYNIGQVNLERSIPVFFEDGRAGLATLKGTGTGLGYNLGIHYQTENKVAVMVNYRSRVLTKLKDGDANFDVPNSVIPNFPAGNTFNAELPLPATLVAGISFPLTERLDMAVDGSYVFYNTYKELKFDYKTNTPSLADTYSLKNYRNAQSIKVGFQHKTTDKLTLRAGTGYVRTPVRVDYVYPETPDNDRVMVNAGLTYSVSEKWEITGAFAYQHILKREATNVESQLTGTYKTNIYAPGIAVSYKW